MMGLLLFLLCFVFSWGLAFFNFVFLNGDCVVGGFFLLIFQSNKIN